MTTDRRAFLARAAACGALASTPFAWPRVSSAAQAQSAPSFNPVPGDWRRFAVTTRVDLQNASGQTLMWLPAPSVQNDWQQSDVGTVTTNGQVTWREDPRYGARMLAVSFAAGEPAPFVELTNRVQTRSRAIDWSAPADATVVLDAQERAFWLAPTELLPTDGVVRQTAQSIVRSADADAVKARKIFDWIVVNTFREPTTKGCGPGDIASMLSNNNLGGKCADINALFVGLCRAAGVPARDVYGVRLAPSAFHYKQLGGNSADLSGAQHCRAEVFLNGRGWVAMDPADVTKVMRHETPEWLRDVNHPVVAPVYKALFGAWEGNWMAWNMAHDVRLPDASGQAVGDPVGFLMYPMAFTNGQFVDQYQPKAFKYVISAQALSA
ncbi:MAG: transglutaminase domain-containing protein [Burkholderiaceae bacterium]|jgi:transglutaminase-like putative cysteine protease|nr:transglutaminase domain-containing protein [Burkholderiaceae bacterium]